MRRALTVHVQYHSICKSRWVTEILAKNGDDKNSETTSRLCNATCFVKNEWSSLAETSIVWVQPSESPVFTHYQRDNFSLTFYAADNSFPWEDSWGSVSVTEAICRLQSVSSISYGTDWNVKGLFMQDILICHSAKSWGAKTKINDCWFPFWGFGVRFVVLCTLAHYPTVTAYWKIWISFSYKS